MLSEFYLTEILEMKTVCFKINPYPAGIESDMPLAQVYRAWIAVGCAV